MVNSDKDISKELRKLAAEHKRGSDISEMYLGVPGCLRKFRDAIRAEFKGYDVETHLSYGKLRVRIGHSTKRMDSGNVGNVRKEALHCAPTTGTPLEEDFGLVFRCPICGQYLPREKFGTRSAKGALRAEVHRAGERQSYCMSCFCAYTVWRHKKLRELGIDGFSPDMRGVYIEEFKAERLAALAEIERPKCRQTADARKETDDESSLR